MVVYSKLTKSTLEQAEITRARIAVKGLRTKEEGELGPPMPEHRESQKTEDTIIAQNTAFYDHRGKLIPNLVLYDNATNRGKKLMPNGELKDCFIKNVRVTIGQFGINPRRKNDEDHVEAIKEVVRSGVPGEAQSRMIDAIEERIKEKRRQQGKLTE